MAKRFGFGRRQRLKSRKQIDDLFVRGKSLSSFPLRAMYYFESSEEESLIQVGVTASKKHFKKAVTRNRIKRLLREAYRLQKIGFLETARQHHKKGYVFFMYTDKTVASFNVIAEAMRKCLLQLEQKLAINEEPS